MDRRRLIEALAERLLEAHRIAVDGPDAAGKTTLAEELAGDLRGRGLEPARISIDDFLRPAVERYRRGRVSAEGYYRDSFDLDALRGAVRAVRGQAIVDGVFLQRPELNDLWDLRIYVHCDEPEILRRAGVRDAATLGGEVEALYAARYLPAQAAYRDAVRPEVLADMLVDNTDPGRPRVLRL